MSERTRKANQRILKDLKKKQSKAEWQEKKELAEVKTSAKSTTAQTVRRSFLGTRIIYNCPKCGQVLVFSKRSKNAACQGCRQSLGWADYDDMRACWIIANDSGEAGYWAEQYAICNGDTYGIDVERWMRLEREYPVKLYFPFPDSKRYGRFMRKAAKENALVSA